MNRSTCFSVASLLGAALCTLSCGSGDSSSAMDSGATTTDTGSTCTDPLATYKASTSTKISFATDIAPILSSPGSCGLGTACHGMPPVALDSAKTKHLLFATDAATVKATLLAAAVNAPTMKLVVPSNVAASFLAHKISGLDSLKCIQSSCVAGATTGTAQPTPEQTPCGDPMPASGLGVLTDSDKTKILDWIAQGAAD